MDGMAEVAPRYSEAFVAGKKDLDVDLALPLSARPVLLTIGFVGAVTTKADVTLTRIPAYDEKFATVLHTVTNRGVGAECFLAWPPEETREPSPWRFQKGTRLRVRWTNPSPDNIEWFLTFKIAF